MAIATNVLAAAQRVGRAVVALCAAALLVACGDHSKLPTDLPTRTPTRTPSATPSATTALSSSRTNHAPTVAIAGADSCHPQNRNYYGITPRTITLEANAQDADGDALSYASSGCASGTARTASCALDRIADFTATVSVSDRHGHDVVASKVLHGVNAAPTNQMAFACGYGHDSSSSLGGCLAHKQPDCPSVPTGTRVICMSDFEKPVYDQEGDEVTCDNIVVTGSGCQTTGTSSWGYGECGGVGRAAAFDFITPTAPTVCTYEAYMRDAWGARFKVATFRIPVVAP